MSFHWSTEGFKILFMASNRSVCVLSDQVEEADLGGMMKEIAETAITKEMMIGEHLVETVGMCVLMLRLGSSSLLLEAWKEVGG